MEAGLKTKTTAYPGLGGHLRLVAGSPMILHVLNGQRISHTGSVVGQLRGTAREQASQSVERKRRVWRRQSSNHGVEAVSGHPGIGRVFIHTPDTRKETEFEGKAQPIDMSGEDEAYRPTAIKVPTNQHRRFPSIRHTLATVIAGPFRQFWTMDFDRDNYRILKFERCPPASQSQSDS